MPANIKPQIVIDTNVWISGLIFGGNPEKVIRLFVDDKITVITSEELMTELRRKIANKFPMFLPHLPLLEASIKERAFMVQLGAQPIVISRDADDNMFIETAVIGKAGYIVTGDKDLLDLQAYKGIQIIKPTEFLKLVDE